MIESFQVDLESPMPTVFSQDSLVPIALGAELPLVFGATPLALGKTISISELLELDTDLVNAPLGNRLAELSVLELGEPISSSSDNGYHGHTYYSAGYVYYQMVDGGWNFGSSQPVPPPPPPDTSVEPPPLYCGDMSSMTPEQLRDYKISVVAAAIAREILSKPDVDVREYGAYILQGANGEFYASPIYAGGPTSVTIGYDGLDLGDIVGMFHSHTASTFPGSDLRLYPTSDNGAPGGHGDWWAFDQTAAAIWNNLLADGQSTGYAEGRAIEFRQYILGPAAGVGTGNYQLRGYSYDNRDTTSLGQLISLNLGLCGA